MNKYENGKIYQISNTINDDVYIGSTTQALNQRMAKHRYDCKKKSCKIYKVMNELGIDNFYIELIEDFPCERKEQLLAREGQVIRERGTLNGVIANRTWSEWVDDNRESYNEKRREYYKTHTEQLKANQKKCQQKRMEEKHDEILAKNMSIENGLLLYVNVVVRCIKKAYNGI